MLDISSYDITIDQEEMIGDICVQLQLKREISVDKDFAVDLTLFEAFRGNGINDYGPAIRLGNSRHYFHLLFAEIKYSYLQFCVFGVVQLKRDYGHVIIRTETFLDKIHEMIHRTEIDFEDDKEFSAAFFVLAENKENALSMISPAFRKQLMDIEETEIIIEIIGDLLIIGSEKHANPASALNFASFITKLASSF